ncbi:MAG: hypothetical protein ACE5IY_12280 [bacterium]
MKIFELEVSEDTVQGRFERWRQARRLEALPVGGSAGDDWFQAGCHLFHRIFGTDRNELRNLLERAVTENLDFAPLLLQVRNGQPGDVRPFEVFWETLVGCTLGTSPPFFFPFGRLPSSIVLARSPNLGSLAECNVAVAEEKKWRVAIVSVPSHSKFLVTTQAQNLSSLLASLSSRTRNFEIVSRVEYTGDNGREVYEDLCSKRVNLVDIIADAADDHHPERISVGNREEPWKPLLDQIGDVATLQMVLLTCCVSDHFRPGAVQPPVQLNDKGVAAVVAWNPRPWDYTLPPFYRAFYTAMAKGSHIARAVSYGRSAILNAINLNEGGEWLNAFAPRLYIHPWARPEQLRFPPPAIE